MSLGFREQSILGKKTKIKFNLSRHITKGVLEYVHSDLWGPTRTQSLNDVRYFLTFIDDFSRKVWVFILKSKNETFEKFKQRKVMVENPTGRNLKCLKIDNELEFCGEKFSNYCRNQ